MWFKKQEQKKFRVVLVGVNGNTTRWDVAPDDMPLVHWMATELAENRDYRATNIVAGEQIRKQAAEIEGLTREVAERREWEAKIKEEYDQMRKSEADLTRACENLTRKNWQLTRELSEASVDFEKDDALFDEAADEIERLTEEVARLEEALTWSKGAHQKADGLFHEAFDANKQMKAEVEALRSQLAAAVSRYVLSEDRACACKAKKGKAK